MKLGVYKTDNLRIARLEIVGGVRLMGLWDSEWGQDRWANGPSKTVYPSENVLVLGVTRPRTTVSEDD